MEMTALLEEEKESFMAGLRAAGSLAESQKVLERTWDRLQLKYVEGESSGTVRALAVHLAQTARAACGFLDAEGEARIWERPVGEGKKKKISTVGAVLFLAALLLIAAAAFILFAKDPDVILKNSALKIGGALFGAGLAALFCAGIFFKKNSAPGPVERKADFAVDAEKCYRRMHTVALVIDHEIENAAAEEKAERRKTEEEKAEALTKEEIELYAGLLEAAYSGDGEYALDRLSDMQYYLHKKEIDVIDCGPDHKAWFDYMPGSGNGTIRPALAYHGKLLKKGLASGDF